MAQAKQPFFPLFLGDLLAATTKWEGEERALYVLLLAYQWFDGPIPKEPSKIAKMVQYDQATFEALWRRVGRKFVEIDEGLINLRCEEHRHRVVSLSQKRAEAGAKGGSKTQAKFKQTSEQTGKQTTSNTGSNEEAKQSVLLGHPTQPNPTQSISNSDRSSRTSTVVEARENDDEQQQGEGGERKVDAEGDADAQMRACAEMARPLRERGVKVTSIHPTLVSWVQDGYTLKQVLGALAIAREAKGESANIHAKYLDAVLRDPDNWPQINRAKPPNGSNGKHAPPKRSVDEAEDEIIIRAIRDGLTDEQIVEIEDLAIAPNLPQRIRAKRQELQREQH